MSRLSSIPVKIEGRACGATVGAGLEALLREIERMLDTLIAEGRADSIDLHSLPFSTEDYSQLETFLGRGEVCITLDADGRSELRETVFPGIWWVRHHNGDDELTAEFLEISQIPAIAVTETIEISDGLDRLRERLRVDSADRSAQ